MRENDTSQSHMYDALGMTSCAIIENDFGEISVDDKILPKTVNKEIIEDVNGCICWTVYSDLVEGLKRLHKRVDKFGQFVCMLIRIEQCTPDSTSSALLPSQMVLSSR